jgi:hypothetical protein
MNGTGTYYGQHIMIRENCNQCVRDVGVVSFSELRAQLIIYE